jgi:hypothetical protein
MTASAVAQLTIRELERLSRSGLDSRAFRHAALRQIKRAVPVDAAFLGNADPTTLLQTDGMVDDILRPYGADFIRIEFLADDVNQFRELARRGRIVGTLDGELGAGASAARATPKSSNRWVSAMSFALRSWSPGNAGASCACIAVGAPDSPPTRWPSCVEPRAT